MYSCTCTYYSGVFRNLVRSFFHVKKFNVLSQLVEYVLCQCQQKCLIFLRHCQVLRTQGKDLSRNPLNFTLMLSRSTR